MERLDEYVARRHAIARRYDERLADLPLTLPWQHPDAYSGLHLYVIRVNPDHRPHHEVFKALRTAGIGVNLHYIPVHTQPYYARMGFKMGSFPQAERYYSEAISLPMYPGLSESAQDEVVTALRAAL
jgi:dTDP-4-amino-4,6-dideoxygalactose transaminase